MEEGYSSEELITSIGRICDICIETIQQEACTISDLDQFLEMLHQKSVLDENEPLRLAVETASRLELINKRNDIVGCSLSMLINTGVVNTMKIIGSNSKSFICDGLIIPVKNSNVGQLGELEVSRNL